MNEASSFLVLLNFTHRPQLEGEAHKHFPNKSRNQKDNDYNTEGREKTKNNNKVH